MFIPKELRVGFQERQDTFTKKLGYVTYIDEKGKLRQENSWRGWCDESIPVLEVANNPKSGFVMNKGITRWGHWSSSGRDKIRIWDPDGFEIEISVDNLIELQSFYDVSKREILGECVYAWEGKGVVLLPTVSPEFQEIWNVSRKQGNKIGIRGLVEGGIYEARDSNTQFMYIGKRALTSTNESRWNPAPTLGVQAVTRAVVTYPIGTEAELLPLDVKSLSHLVTTVPPPELEAARSLSALSIMAGIPEKLVGIPFPDELGALFVEEEDPTKTPRSWLQYGYPRGLTGYPLPSVKQQLAILLNPHHYPGDHGREALAGAFYADYAKTFPAHPLFLWKKKGQDVVMGLLHNAPDDWRLRYEPADLGSLIVAEYKQDISTISLQGGKVQFGRKTLSKQKLSIAYPEVKTVTDLWNLMKEEMELLVLQMHNGAQTLAHPVLSCVG